MNRRTILLLAAALVAALGTALVFLYVKGADNRAEERFDTVEVLRAVAPIEKGESIDDAASSGKLALEPVAQNDLLPNHQTDTEQLKGLVATTTIYPGEQIVSDKFGAGRRGARGQVRAGRPQGRHRHLGEPHRPRSGRRVPQPRLRGGRHLRRDRPGADSASPGCCCPR